ncbi:MAG: hypothetical protein J7K68_02000 [Candidatus Diapherotrites archaeon]|nr:hypothetical protein [Candidatus Diapherotrites archaeon]
MAVKLRELIPPAIVGGIITAALFGLSMLFMQPLLSETTFTQEELAGMLLFLYLVGGIGSSLIGGFISSYFATKQLKSRLERGTLSGLFSGITASLILVFILVLLMSLSTQFLTVLFSNTAQSYQIIQELFFLFVILTGSLGYAGALGGAICTFILGTGKSEILKAFSKSKQNLSLRLYLPVFLFTLIPILTAEYIDTTSPLYSLLLIIFSLIFLSISLTFVIRNIKQKEELMKSIKHVKPVFLSILAASIPAAILFFFSSIWVIYFPQYLNIATSLLSIFTITLSIIYLFLISFVAQAALLPKKKGVKEAIKGSILFTKKHWPSVLSLYVLIFFVGITISFASLFLNYILNIMHFDLSLFINALFKSFYLLISVSIQTIYYLVKK